MSVLVELIAKRPKGEEGKEQFLEQTIQAIVAITEKLVVEKGVEPGMAFEVSQNLILNALNIASQFKFPEDRSGITLATEMPKKK